MKNNSIEITYADMSEILFDGRNQSYGGYQIRKQYANNVMRAFILTVSTLLGLLLIAFFVGRQDGGPSVKDHLYTMTAVTLPTVSPPSPPTINTAAPVIPEHSEKPKAAEQQKGMDSQESKNVVATVSADDSATMAADSLFEDKQPGLVTTDSSSSDAIGGDPRGTEEGPTDNPASTEPPGIGTESRAEPDPEPFKVHLGTMPTAINMDEIRRRIGFPKGARELGMSGKVTYRVLVDQDGNYMRHVILKASHPLFEKACRKHLREIRFEPGKMGEQPVKVWVVIPFQFILTQ